MRYGLLAVVLIGAVAVYGYIVVSGLCWIVVRNHTGGTVAISVDAGGEDIGRNTLADRKWVIYFFTPKADSDIAIACVRNGEAENTIHTDYVTPGMSGGFYVTLMSCSEIHEVS